MCVHVCMCVCVHECVCVTQTNPKKWTETCWRALFYTVLTVYGIYSAWDKDWLWNLEAQWLNYPLQAVDPDVQRLYMIQLAVYETFNTC